MAWHSSSSIAGATVALTVSTESQMFAPGTLVHARWKGGSFFPGVVHAIAADGFYCIHFDDGDKDPHCPAAHVKLKGTETFSPGIGFRYALDEIFVEVLPYCHKTPAMRSYIQTPSEAQGSAAQCTTCDAPHARLVCSIDGLLCW